MLTPHSDPRVVCNYWTVELAFPLKSVAYLQTGVQLPPSPGTQWRINFSRVEYHVQVVNGQYEKVIPLSVIVFFL